MKDKMIVEEISRIGEIMGINHLLVENPGFFRAVTKSAKSGKKIVDLSKLSTTALKTVKYGAIETKVFKQIKSLGSSSKGFTEAVGIGLATKKLSPELSKVLKMKAGELPGAAIIRNIDNPKFIMFMNGTGKEVSQINKNIQRALGNVPGAGATTITSMNTVTSNLTKVKGPKVVKPKKVVTPKKVKVTGKTPKGPTGKAIKNTLGKTGAIMKTGWAWTKRVVIGNILGRLAVLGLGAWAAWELFQWWFEEDGRLSSEQAMKTAFSGHLASEYDNNIEHFNNSLGSGEAKILAEQVVNNPQTLDTIVKDRCKSLRDISAISFHWSNTNGGSQLYDMLKAWENSDRSQGGFSGLYDPLDSIVSNLPLVILGGVACFTISELQAQEQLLGIERDDIPTKGDVQGDWSNYPCILTMLEEYNGSVGNSGDIEYIKITIDNRDAYFTPNGKVQLEDFSDNSKNLHGTYTCDSETSVKFEESRKLSDILKESKLIVEETVEFGNVTISLGGGSGEENPTTTYNDSDSQTTNGDVDSQTTNSGGSGLKYVTTSVTLADVVSGNGELKKGDKGDSVRAIQTSVNTKDDSMFGPNTEEAVRVYQKRNGLEVTGTINQETAKRIVGTTDITQSGNVVSVDTEITQQDTNDMDKVETELDNTEPEYIEDQIADLESQIERAPTKQACKTLIASAAAGIKKGVRLNDLSSLKQCYNSYNFYAIGDGSKKVRKHYGLKGKGNI